MKNRIRMGMIGGGQGAFIGEVHRIAAAIDQRIELVCGAFSSTRDRSISSGRSLGLPEQRCYGDFDEMIRRERELPSDRRMQFVSIVTPNHMHFPPAKLALESGFHVLCDKPATFNLQEAKDLKSIVETTGKLYGLTHNYTGYPLVKEARHFVLEGRLGAIRKVVADYPQGWLSTKLEESNQKQATWRTDPERAGAAGCIGDIGTHAENLISYVTGLEIKELCADLTTFVEGRRLDDDGSILVRFDGGARGIIHASQICVGEENNLSIRVYGEKGSLEWHQKEPNTLAVKWIDAPTQIYRTGLEYLSERSKFNTRTPPAHPEGYLEAFANIYRNFADHIHATEAGIEPDLNVLDYPTIDDGIRGLAFIQAAVESSKSGATWVLLPS